MKHLPLGRGKTDPMILQTDQETVLGGQFYWGGTLPKSNAGAQRLA